MTVLIGRLGARAGVGAGVGESDEGDDGVDDDVKSEKSSPGGCRYVRISESVGLVFRVCV